MAAMMLMPNDTFGISLLFVIVQLQKLAILGFRFYLSFFTGMRNSADLANMFI